MDSAERKALKARAHNLEPVVLIGSKGVTDEVIAEIDRALKAHELIKVRAPGLDRHQRADALGSIVERTKAENVQHIGKVFKAYRNHPRHQRPQRAFHFDLLKRVVVHQGCET